MKKKAIIFLLVGLMSAQTLTPTMNVFANENKNIEDIRENVENKEEIEVDSYDRSEKEEKEKQNNKINEQVNSRSEARLDDWDYVKEGDSFVLIKYKGKSKDVVIPARYRGFDVVLNDFNFINDSSITSIKFESDWMGRKVKYKGKSIRMTGSTSQVNRSLKSVDLSGLDTSNVTSMDHMFSGCYNLTSVNLNGIDTSNVTDMSYMFSNCCYNLTSVDLSGLDTSNVTNMTSMFDGCDNLTSVNLNGLDTSNVTHMSYMFSDCGKLNVIDLSSFNASKANIYRMFFMAREQYSPLLIITKDSKLKNYDYHGDSRTKLSTTLDANGGKFKDNSTSKKGTLDTYVMESRDGIPPMSDISEEPTKDGYSFIKYNYNLDKNTYFAEWREGLTVNAGGTIIKPGIHGGTPSVDQNSIVTVPQGGIVILPNGVDVTNRVPESSLVTQGGVIVTTNDNGKKPLPVGDGSIIVPEGGTVILPDGSEIKPPAGSIVNPNGDIIKPIKAELDADKGGLMLSTSGNGLRLFATIGGIDSKEKAKYYITTAGNDQENPKFEVESVVLGEDYSQIKASIEFEELSKLDENTNTKLYIKRVVEGQEAKYIELKVGKVDLTNSFDISNENMLIAVSKDSNDSVQLNKTTKANKFEQGVSKIGWNTRGMVVEGEPTNNGTSNDFDNAKVAMLFMDSKGNYIKEVGTNRNLEVRGMYKNGKYKIIIPYEILDLENLKSFELRLIGQKIQISSKLTKGSVTEFKVGFKNNKLYKLSEDSDGFINLVVENLGDVSSTLTSSNITTDKNTGVRQFSITGDVVIPTIDKFDSNVKYVIIGKKEDKVIFEQEATKVKNDDNYNKFKSNLSLTKFIEANMQKGDEISLQLKIEYLGGNIITELQSSLASISCTDKNSKETFEMTHKENGKVVIIKK